LEEGIVAQGGRIVGIFIAGSHLQERSAQRLHCFYTE
jgi:hypothetical protein